MGDTLKMLIFAGVAFVFFTFPSTWLLTLFLGNIGMELSYAATLGAARPDPRNPHITRTTWRLGTEGCMKL
jgi:hypothetical protein